VKVSLFAQAPYRALPADFEQRFESVVTTPWDLVDPDEIPASFRDFLDQLMAGARYRAPALAIPTPSTKSTISTTSC
jgi:hypothetical protein